MKPLINVPTCYPASQSLKLETFIFNIRFHLKHLILFLVNPTLLNPNNLSIGQLLSCLKPPKIKPPFDLGNKEKGGFKMVPFQNRPKLRQQKWYHLKKGLKFLNKNGTNSEKVQISLTKMVFENFIKPP